LTANGWTLELNGTLLTNISYSNTSQVIVQNGSITTMSATPTPAGAASYIYYQLWGAPTGMTINGYTGAISASSVTGAPDEYAMMVRGTAWGGYTGVFELPITITVTTTATLSSATDTSTGETTGSGTVSTDRNAGTLYWSVRTTGSPLTAANIKTGTGAVVYGNQSVSGTGVQNISITGLTASTTYYVDYVHTYYTVNSNVVSGDGFTTDSGAPTLENYLYIDFGFTSPVVNAYGDYFAKVDHTKYTAGATQANLIDHTNTATTIDFTNVVAWTGEASNTSTRYNGVLDFLPAEVTRDAWYLTSASTMEIQLDVSGESGWAGKTYVVKGGGFRAFLGSQAAGNGEVSTDNYATYDTYSCAWDAIGGGADPNSAVQTWELPAVPNGSGIISIKWRKASGATEVENTWLGVFIYN